MSKRYTIEKITDVLQIPENRFEDFLVDFRAYYSLGRSVPPLIDEIASSGGISVNTIPQHFIWIDDGKHDAKVILKAADSPTTTK